MGATWPSYIIIIIIIIIHETCHWERLRRH